MVSREGRSPSLLSYVDGERRGVRRHGAAAAKCDLMRYVCDRPIGLRPYSGVQLMRGKLSRAKNLFRKDLHAHYGCVNAIEFSNEGDWLISGGDDRRILLWNVEKAIHGNSEPVGMKGEHNSNIFCLGFDNQNTKIFSAGNDEQVIVHDTHTGVTLDVFLHEEAVYGISVDPLNSNVFASACDDGRILIWDIREPSSTEPFCLASYSSAFHAVMYNPVEPRLLATANSKEGVSLWDIRHPRSWLVRYGGLLSTQSCMSVRFNQNGSRVLALRRRLPPILFDVYSPTNVCQFDHTGYYNSCTMKSCSFAGDSDQYVLSGSDDFNLYMWKIPEEGCRPFLENWVEEAHMVLKGHRSIVNQVRCNPSNFLLASSGVEKIIKLWSPFTIPRSTGGLMRNCRSADRQRKVYSHLEYINMVMHSGQVMTHDYSHKSTREDPRMMAFFDSLVQREIEGLASDSSLSSGMSDSWLYNVAGTAILSDLGSTSDGSSDEDGENRAEAPAAAAAAYNNSGPRVVHAAAAAPPPDVSRADGQSVDPDADSSSGGVADERDGGDSRATDGETDSDHSVMNTISWLIRQKRQQMLQAARERWGLLQGDWPPQQQHRKSSSAERRATSRVTRNNSRAVSSPSSPSTNSSSSTFVCPSQSPSLSTLSSDAAAVEVSESSSSSSVSTPSSSSSPGLNDADSVDDDIARIRRLVTEHRKKAVPCHNSDAASAAPLPSEVPLPVTDRRKLLRKRRARILQDLSDSDSGMDDELPRKKKPCAAAAEKEGAADGTAATDNVPFDGGNYDLNARVGEEAAGSVVLDLNGSSPTEELGESSSGSSSTPDSGITLQGSKACCGTTPSEDGSPEGTSQPSAIVKFKNVRVRANGGKRQYRATANGDSKT